LLLAEPLLVVSKTSSTVAFAIVNSFFGALHSASNFFKKIPKASVPHRYPKQSLTHSHYDENKKIQQLIAQIWMGPNNKLLNVRVCQDVVYLVIEEEEAEKNLL